MFDMECAGLSNIIIDTSSLENGAMCCGVLTEYTMYAPICTETHCALAFITPGA